MSKSQPEDSRLFEPVLTFLRDMRFAVRSLGRTKGLAFTVVLTLALGIGANAAIFSLVRGVLLRPLVNRDEDRLIYIRQSARGIGAENAVFSVPEIQDLRAGVKTLSEFGDFSTIGFTMIGLGEPREVRAGVVGGSYFEVMGLHPVLGRLLGPQDDGPKAAGAAVLTYRFWTTVLKSDPTVIGKSVRLGSFGERSATIVGVLEPSVPYPAETEIIANIVTSPHHLSATMQNGRVHRMTELFGRLAPGATLESARAELRAVHGAMVKAHPEAYTTQADFRIDAKLLRDQITSRARTVLLVLLAASGLVFIIACSNVANLILSRTVRREGELSIRAALGATTGALRRVLLAESLLLCGAGATLGVLSARPMVDILARYASRFSVRALDLTVDSSMLWVGAALGVPVIAGRDFDDSDRRGGESVVIVSQSLAQRMFPGQDAVNRHIMWTDPVMKFIDISTAPRRIVGVAADVDDEHVVPGPALTVYHPFEQQEVWGGRLFVHASTNPYALVTPITRIIRDMSVDQPVERAATLEDVRAEVLTPDRLNTVVFGGFAAVALAIAVVGVAGVLAFSVSGRTREFGIRLAIGSQPRHLLTGVIAEGVVMASAGVIAGAVCGFALARLAGSYFLDVHMPGAVPVIGSAVVLLAAAVVASVVPAARAARVDVMQALRSD